MRRIKVALDCDIPERLTRPLNDLYGENGFEFVHVRDLGHGMSEDETWAAAFRQFGGEVAISADKKITARPHKLLAFQQSELKTYIMEPGWHQKLNFKAAHLIYWWPAIQRHLSACEPGECWQVPVSISGCSPDKLKALRLPHKVAESFKKATG